MNYGIVFSQELQKQAFPVGALIGGTLVGGLGLLSAHGDKLKLPGTLALTAGLGGIGALLGHNTQSNYEKRVKLDKVLNNLTALWEHEKSHYLKPNSAP